MSCFSLVVVVIGLVSIASLGDAKFLTPKVKTKIGPVVGLVESFKDGKVNYFQGVPYAKPPVGDLRLQKPVPYIGNGQVIEAIKQPPICYQPRLSIGGVFAELKLSEDCLYLDIVQRADALESKTKKPVLVDLNVFIAGFTEDASGIPKIDVREIVQREDIIVVVVSSRLNFFGYAYSKNYPQLKGNLGLWDQNLALKWINENIEAFNGDPNAVTLLGDGSSAEMVAAHVLSPFAKGLFKNVYMINGGLAAIGERISERVTLSTDIVIKRVGCGEAKDVLSCLQGVDPKKIIDSLPSRATALRNVFHSEYVPTSRDKAIVDSYFNDVNALVGFDRDAASILVAAIAPQVFADAKLTYQSGLDVIRNVFQDDFSKELAGQYFGSSSKPSDIRQGLIDLFTDILIACPQYEFAERLASKQKKGVTRTYINIHALNTPSLPLCSLDKALGVCIKTAPPLIYGYPFLPQKYYLYDDEDRAVSQYDMDLTQHYMKTG